MNKQVDMSAFVGKDFDCEFWVHEDRPDMMNVYRLKKIRDPEFDWIEFHYSPDKDGLRQFAFCRPRLKKAQVLDDWSWVPDGLVWNVITVYEDSHNHYENVLSASLSSIPDTCNFVVAACIGVELSYELWGKERGMPVVTL